MSLYDFSHLNEVVFISGTPCTGKTTIATELNNHLNNHNVNSTLIKINDLAIEKGLVIGEDPDKFYKIIDIYALNDVLSDMIKEFKSNTLNLSQTLIVEGHLSHLCHGADKMIILRLNPDILKNRLESRGYIPSKVQENLEAEALAVCLAEAYEIYDENLNEIDTTDKSVEEVLDMILEVITGESKYPIGSVDFMDWFLD